MISLDRATPEQMVQALKRRGTSALIITFEQLDDENWNVVDIPMPNILDDIHWLALIDAAVLCGEQLGGKQLGGKSLGGKSHSRKHIPQDVKDKVWRRDEGRCVQCGKNENLEFDHIIPVSLGGANTYRNIQLLCETCNRSKSARI